MTQKTGALIFDETADRYDIRFDVNDYYGGLHCGDCMEVFGAGQMEAYPYGVWGQLVSCGYSGGRPFRAAGTDLTGRRENGRSFFHARPTSRRRAYHHRTRKEETHCRRKPRKDHSPLHQDRKADGAAAPKGYESPACTDEKAA
ncbi:hypothetical protein QIY_3141 [Clostridioides difficile DA00141]|nr:hypothetical protein QIY_3141 [Clostridioides difficile DA00141]